MIRNTPLINSFKNLNGHTDDEIEKNLKVLNILVGENEVSKIKSNALRLIKSKVSKRKK